MKTMIECACGCGQTLQAVNRRGYKNAYVRNHKRNRPNELIECACGCGQTLWRSDPRGRDRTMLPSHWSNIQPNTREMVNCASCGTEIPRQNYLREQNKSGLYYCNLKCMGKWRAKTGATRGEKNGHYNTITVPCAGCGKDVTKAYSLIMRRNNRVFCPDCVPEHLRRGRPGFYVGYPREFSAPLRHRIRVRDSHTCQICGKHQRDTRTLHIHHIDYDKSHNDPMNLIALCPSCHAQTNFATNVWRKRLQALMQTRFPLIAA